jgi:hypothetical protein
VAYYGHSPQKDFMTWAKTRAVPFLSPRSLNAMFRRVAKRLNIDVSQVRAVASGGHLSRRIWLAIQEEIAHSANVPNTRRTIWIATLASASMLLVA